MSSHFRFIAFWVSLAFGLLMWAQAPTDALGSITSALRSGQFDQALQLLRSALEEHPKSAQLWTLRGIALSGKNDRKEALDAFKHALSFSSEYLPALEGAAQIEYDTGGKEASVLLKRVLALRPHDATSHAMLGVLAAQRGDCAGAVAHFNESGSVLDSQPGALQQYGACLIQLKETEKAISVFQRALGQPGPDQSTRYQLASAQMMAQLPKDAIQTLTPLLQKETPDIQAMELSAFAYEADKNTPEAVRILRQAIVAAPHDVELYLDFANLALDHQSYQVGVDMMNTGLQAEPNSAQLYVARGVLYVQLAQYDQAEADFLKADTLDPHRSIASAAEGLAAVQKDDPADALSTVRAKLANKPNDPFLLYLQADILMKGGPEKGSPEFREAIDSAKKAVGLRPSLAAAHDVLAKLYLQEGENEAAITHSRKALASDPKDQTALYHLIQALRKTGQTKDIPDLLKKLADLRMESAKEEAEHNRYKLVEERSPSLEKQLP